MDPIMPILKVAAAIQPAAAILVYIWDEVMKVEANKERLVDLLRRCHKILGAIDEEIAKRPDQDVRRACERLMRNMTFLKTIVERLARMSFIRALLHRDDISREINECHIKLSDCLTLFQVSAVVDLRNYVRAMREAQERDQQTLLQQLEKLEKNDMEIMNVLKVVGNQMEAMLAMQKNLAKQADDSAEQRILHAGVAALQRSTNNKGISKPQDWALTSYDVEIDYSSRLGAGGFGCVRKGRFNRLVVAVKEMTKETDQKMLLREIKAWNKLKHDNVVPFYGASILASPPFLVSRYMKNGNVTSYLKKNPNTDRVKLLHEISLGVLYIHNQNIIHGDLKGVNVLVDDAGIACITDFGLATIKAQAKSTSVILMSVPRSGSTSLGSAEVYIQGTLRYMAPEALRGRTTKKVDVYAFAMTAYEIFTGECPFLTIPDGYFFNYILQDKGRLPRPEEKLVADRGLNDEMWHLMMECSSYSPNDRPNFDSIASTTEMLKDEWQQTAQANTAPVVVTPADELDELEDLLDGIQIHTTNVSNQNVQNQVGFSDIRNIAGSSSPPDHSMTLNSDTQSSSDYTSGQFQSLFGSQDQNRFGSPGTPMTTAGLTLANTPSPWLNSPPASNLTPEPFVSSRTLPPTPIGTYPTLPREEALARRRRILAARVKNGQDMIKLSSIARRISSTAFVAEGKRSWENFLSTIISHLEDLENNLSVLRAGSRIIQADLPGLWAERLSKRFTDFQFFALTIDDPAYSQAPKTAVTRLYHADDRLMEDYDVSLWMASTALDSDTFESNASLLRPGGLLLAMVSKQGDKKLISHPAFKMVKTWTALSRTREGGAQTARFVVAERI